MQLSYFQNKSKDHFTGLITVLIMGWTLGPPIIYIMANVLMHTVALNTTTCTDDQMNVICSPTLDLPETCYVTSNILPVDCTLNSSAAFRTLVVREIDFNQSQLAQFATLSNLQQISLEKVNALNFTTLITLFPFIEFIELKDTPVGNVARIPIRNTVKEIHGFQIHVNNAPLSTLNFPKLTSLSAESIAFKNYFFFAQAELYELIYNSPDSLTFHWGEIGLKSRPLRRLTLQLNQVSKFPSEYPCPFFNLQYYSITAKNAELVPKMLMGKSWETPPDRSMDGPLKFLAELKLNSFKIDKRVDLPILPSLTKVSLINITGSLAYLYGLPSNLTHLTIKNCPLRVLYQTLLSNFTKLQNLDVSHNAITIIGR